MDRMKVSKYLFEMVTMKERYKITHLCTEFSNCFSVCRKFRHLSEVPSNFRHGVLGQLILARSEVPTPIGSSL
jgi:hypothetical protein